MGCVSIPQQMLLLNKARSKLMQCAMVKDQNRDYDLRQMVAHANLLDNLLRTEEEEAKHFERIDAVHEGGLTVPPPPVVMPAPEDDIVRDELIGKNGEIISPECDDMMFDMDDKEYHNMTNCSDMLDRCRRYEDSLVEEERCNNNNITNDNSNDTTIPQVLVKLQNPYHIASGLEPAEEEQLEYEEEREEEMENLMEQGELPEDMGGYHRRPSISPRSSDSSSSSASDPVSPAARAADQVLRDMRYTNAISAAYNNLSPTSKEVPRETSYIDA